MLKKLWLVSFLCLGTLSLHAKPLAKQNVEQTLSIIKPDGVKKNLIGKIVSKFEEGGLEIVAARMMQLTERQAQDFYSIHKGKPFYDSFVQFMTSGPVLVMVLQGKDAVSKNREIMGATDPKKASAGTIRKQFAESIEVNTVHGSDSRENAKKEIEFFFASLDICLRS